MIPEFKCKDGCIDCCGVVPFTSAEKARASLLQPLVDWTDIGNGNWIPTGAFSNMTCPFSKTGGCQIYDDRPMICRRFGSVDSPLLTCPHGCGPEKKLTNAQASNALAEAS